MSIIGHSRWGIDWWTEPGGGLHFRYTAYCLRLGPLTLKWASRDGKKGKGLNDG